MTPPKSNYDKEWTAEHEQFMFCVLAIGDTLARRGLIDLEAKPPLSLSGLQRADQVLAALHEHIVAGDVPPPNFRDVVKMILDEFDDAYKGRWNKPETVDAIWECVQKGEVPDS